VDEERKELLSQRHDFIKEYYKMATSDLDRHLKAGWQTIVVLGGGAAILTAGHEGKIGLPIATTIALLSAFWGTLSVIDANYWSLRAIAFLSNVEAIYFAEDDRSIFNPYIGHRPSYKLLNSLRYMFGLSFFFAIAAILNMAWELLEVHHTISDLFKWFSSVYFIERAIWILPLVTLLWGLFLTLLTWSRRLQDYVNFSSSSPGPTIRLKSSEMWDVTFMPPAGHAAPTLAGNTPTGGRSGEIDLLCNLKILKILSFIVVISTTILLIYITFYQIPFV